MLGNLSVHRRHNRAAVRASRVGALAFPTHDRWIHAALLATAALFAARVAHGRTSCPITTHVAPYADSTSARYEIVLTDGGAGDLDGAANGSCETAIELCKADASACGDV